jgi:hypothetical protein
MLTIAFILSEISPRKLIGKTYIPAVALPIYIEDKDQEHLSFLSSVNDCDASTFGPEDMEQIEAELMTLLNRHPHYQSQLQSALALAQICKATKNTSLRVTPFGERP